MPIIRCPAFCNAMASCVAKRPAPTNVTVYFGEDVMGFLLNAQVLQIDAAKIRQSAGLHEKQSPFLPFFSGGRREMMVESIHDACASSVFQIDFLALDLMCRLIKSRLSR